MKTIRRLGVLITGLALLAPAFERTGSGRVVRELHAMSGALVVILALSLIRLPREHYVIRRSLRRLPGLR